MHPTLILCSLALAALVLLLGFWVSIARTQARVVTGAGDDPTSALMKAVRAHANSAEYAGALIGLFVVTSFAYAGRDLGLAVTSLVLAITAARVLHALGFLVCRTLARPHPLKAIGAIITYFGGLALAVMAALQIL